MTFEGSTSFVAADDVRLSKSSASVISPYDGHRRTLQSEGRKCFKIDIVSCTQFLSYSCNIVQEVALTSSALE